MTKINKTHFSQEICRNSVEKSIIQSLLIKYAYKTALMNSHFLDCLHIHESLMIVIVI